MSDDLLHYIKEKVDNIEKKLDDHYVRKGAFAILSSVVLLMLAGLVGMVLK